MIFGKKKKFKVPKCPKNNASSRDKLYHLFCVIYNRFPTKQEFEIYYEHELKRQFGYEQGDFIAPLDFK